MGRYLSHSRRRKPRSFKSQIRPAICTSCQETYASLKLVISHEWHLILNAEITKYMPKAKVRKEKSLLKGKEEEAVVEEEQVCIILISHTKACVDIHWQPDIIVPHWHPVRCPLDHKYIYSPSDARILHSRWCQTNQ